MNPEDMKARTRAFALRIIRLAESLPNTPTANTIRNQMLRCGPSVGANYRAACRAKSKADFAAKMGIVEEEADESLFWIELLIDAEIIKRARVEDLMSEGDEILAITVSSIKTARGFSKAG
ncbi:MAG TPA: four helix bundle protein [Pyrinomonadaceae bacterium]|nr:four helix bundle protein [Pyrinomonadaceae bacterium]